MAESLLSFGVEKLWNLLDRESRRFQGVEEQVNELKRQLELLRCFLIDADAKKHINPVVKYAVNEVKEIVYDAEDIIETFLLKEELGKESGIKERIRRLACVPTERRKIALEMESLSNRISKMMQEIESFGVQQIIVNDGYTQSLQERQREMRQAFLYHSQNILVGVEDNAEILVGHLVKNESSQVVSIIGMGGIGKTTLARQVFKHKTVKSHFARLAWVCVSQQFTRKYVWQTILRQLKPEYKVLKMREDEVQEKLFRALEIQNALIVLDDVWKEEDWDRIKPIFPPVKGWKLLLTTRNEDVAIRADPTCIIFKSKYLTTNESWKLFREIVFGRERIIENKGEMEEMGKHMIKHCGGLPLAIKVLSGLLTAQHTLRDWKRIYENIGSHIVGGTSFNDRNISSVYHVLYLSFEELPVYLKHCFLYLAHFPKNYIIDVPTLSYYWAAEGVPRPNYYDGATIQEVANKYIDELVKRNMVIAGEDEPMMSSRYETCRLHDMMRKVCKLKAKEENFVQIVDASTITTAADSQSPCKSRRLVVRSTDTIYHMEEGIKNQKVRSLLFIKQYPMIGWKASGLCFSRLQLMRVLDLSKAEFKGGKLPPSIGMLIHLKYLSLYHAQVSHLPSSMQNLKLLLYLDLCVALGSPVYIPNVLKKLPELRYLSLPTKMHDDTKLELGTLINLEVLKNLSTKHSSMEDLHSMQMLKTLSVVYNSEGCSMKTLSSHLGQLSHLENLVIGGHWSYCFRKNSLCEGTMVFLRGEFPELRNLELYELYELEEWVVRDGAMPRLHTLSIHSCPTLMELPDGLRFLEHLKELSVITTSRVFKENLSRHGHDYYKVQCIPSLEILCLT